MVGATRSARRLVRRAAWGCLGDVGIDCLEGRWGRWDFQPVNAREGGCLGDWAGERAVYRAYALGRATIDHPPPRTPPHPTSH